MLSLGIIPDLHWTAHGYAPRHKTYADCQPAVATTNWYLMRQGSPANTLTAHLPTLPQDEHYVMMIAVGIRFGILAGEAEIQQVVHAGSAKVLAVR
jgi:hypothetical protein